ncbi:MAG: hypothetical protein RR585_01795 [Coprobacillus sp.]
MIYTEIERVIKEIVFAKEQEQRKLTQAEQEIYHDWLEIKRKVEEQWKD